MSEAEQLHRIQMELTKEELESVERLAVLCGLSKTAAFLAGILVFRWAATQTLLGREICSSKGGQVVKTYDLAVLEALKRTADLTSLSEEELERRLSGPMSSYEDVRRELEEDRP